MKIEVIKADILELEVDVIVNPANTSLLGGSGVDGIIHRKGGKQILEECLQIRNKQGGCKVGEAVITTAGNLKCKKVIHTVGPKWNNGTSNEALKLASCYENRLRIAEKEELATIAFPNISTGIYGYPKEKASKIAISVIKSWSWKNVKKVIFTCYDEENYKIYKKTQML